MRTEKYNPDEGGDDIKYAFEYNGLSAQLQEIDVIVAEVCGEHDGNDWHWILQMKDGTFHYASGGCDYTGWDCQSYASISESVNTVQEALEFSPKEDSYHRGIKRVLTGQIEGTIPFAIYEV